jgi:hypothetical protein
VTEAAVATNVVALALTAAALAHLVRARRPTRIPVRVRVRRPRP